jgi:hypothetical protein
MQLRGVMVAMIAECNRVVIEDHSPIIVKLNENPKDYSPVRWPPVSLFNVMRDTWYVVEEFAPGSDIVPRIANGLSRIAMGLFALVGLHFTRHHFTTTWATHMMPNVFGVSRVLPAPSIVVRADAADPQHIAAYMSYYFTYMLAISATDDDAFPPFETLDFALQLQPTSEEDANDKALLLARAKQRFGMNPWGIEVWNTPLMDAIDDVFKEWFVSSEGKLRPEFGTNHQWHSNYWRLYREDVVKAAKKVLKPVYVDDVVSRILARLQWFMLDENEHLHHRLPFPTATCLQLVGDRLLECEVALTEVSDQHWDNS